MLLAGKVAIIFGGSGAIGGAVAHAMACEGALVHLAARHQDKLDAVAESVRAQGGTVSTFTVDVLDEQATQRRVAQLAEQAHGIDVVVNATGFMHEQGKHLERLSLAEFRQGIDPFLAAQFIIAKSTAPYLGGRRQGVMLTVVAPAAAMAMPGHLGHIVGCAATEAFIKALASELGPRNIRVLGVRSHAIIGAVEAGSYTGEIFRQKAQAMELTVDEWLGGAAQGTLLKQLPTLEQVAGVITFLAADAAGAMTATIVNVTAGATLS
ncbi:SDR family NAD(P)-dependent oxidoreductase [Kluyvera georgiana]|uniref:SDR family NAD(P)-dependent oxidoreductase n=1 Tax=Kluyvera georgiana TaxID=73098 RepID=UPI0008071A44|nr:SDR family oxidoreductase [Kluyvera georgiana]